MRSSGRAPRIERNTRDEHWEGTGACRTHAHTKPATGDPLREARHGRPATGDHGRRMCETAVSGGNGRSSSMVCGCSSSTQGGGCPLGHVRGAVVCLLCYCMLLLLPESCLLRAAWGG
jgi:hypothetical protein